MNSSIKVRFAPSPTGYLHVGNVRTALVNWLFAKQQGGTFMLRIEDTDIERSRPEYEAAIKEDLAWLGLEWQEEAKQSARLKRYEEAKQTLLDAGRLYACYDTAEELDIKRKMLISRGKPPVYDRAGLHLTEKEIKAHHAEGRTPHYRFLLNDNEVVWQDMIRGEVRFARQFSSDPVVIRADGMPLFTLAGCVDDGELGITHMLRGEDHVSNSAVQVQIFEALGYPVPHMGHLALLAMKEGKLSKREGSASIRELREKGVMPLAITSYLAKIGTSDTIELAENMEALTTQFATSKFGRSTATFEEEELARINAKLLHQATYADVQEWLLAHNVRITEAFWSQIQANIAELGEVQMWWELVEHPVTPLIEDTDYCALAATFVPNEELTTDSWKQFTAQLAEKTGRKGKQLFMPLRLALTARSDGPELPVLFSLLTREKIIKRLQGEIA